VEIRAESEPFEATAPGAGPADGANVILSVTDHGPGIPVEEQELIFQKFVRGSAAKSTQVAGTGIGLAACRVLARGLGGSVGVDSAPGEGATFHLWVPLRRGAPATVIDDASFTVATGAAALIVEDEDYNRIVLKGTAEELGYRVEVATTAAEARRVLEAQRFDVVFLDWELPGLKGGTIAQALRAQSGGDEPVVLATTAHDSEEMRRRCREAGMDDFLLKPFNAEQVRRQIAAVRATRKAKAEGSVVAPLVDDTAAANELNLEAFQLYGQASGASATAPAQHYVDALEKEIAAMVTALAGSDRGRVKGAAHRVRALAALVNARALNEAAHAIEESAAHAPVPELETRHRALAAECQHLRERLLVGAGSK
jgi:CheY-like chemotaxis protein